MGDTILMAVALQRYGDITPRAIAVRDVAADMAEFFNAPLAVLTVHVQLALMPEGEDTETKMERLVAPLMERGLRVESMVREGSPRVRPGPARPCPGRGCRAFGCDSGWPLFRQLAPCRSL